MRRTPILRFRASLAPRAKAPLIDIKAATFYRHLPSVEPSDEERLSNPPLFPGLDFSFPSENVSNQYWAISGPSNAGKTTFLEVLRGHHLCFPPTARKYPYLSSAEIEAKDHRLRYPGHAIQYVGFDTKERGLSGMGTYLSARYESRREATDFSVLDYLKGNTQLNALPVEEAIDSGLFDRVVEDMRLGPLLDMPFTNLSNGQTRRTRIAKALLGKPELLLLDEPFMGLDPPTMRTLSPILHRLASTDSPRLLLALRPQDPVPDWITHILYLGEDMKVTLQGPKDAVGQALIDEVTTFNEGRESAAKPPRFNTEFGRQLTRNGIVEHKKKAATLEDFEMALVKAQADWDAGNTSYAMKLELERLERMVTNPTKSKPQKALVDRAWLAEYTHIGEPVIEMEGVSVKYGDRPVLGNWEMRDSDSEEVRKGLWWTVHQGQRWGIFGPNGSGKTTLLSLILSDHPQSYSVPMKIFGRSRLPSPGQAGMSIFELQRRIGHSSPEVHGFFPRHLTVRQVLESAYADTPLARPTLSVEADARIDACLRWFQAELNPSIGMHYRLKQDLLRRGQRPSKDRVAMAGDPVRYKLVVETEEFELEQEMAASVEWADDLRFGEIPFSAQRVALFIRAIVAQPDIVILDEAFSGMDDYIRDKCLLFLDHGESKRLSLYSSSDHMVPNYENYIAITRPSSETLDYYVITEGLTDKQALLVVSHVREEVPASVRDWIFLPESETGAPCMIGKVKFKPLRADKLVWDMIWGLVPFEAEKRKTPKIRVREKKAAPVKKGRVGRPPRPS